MAEKIFCMKPVQMKPVLAEEVAAVKNSPHQHRSKQPIDKTANEAHLQRTMAYCWNHYNLDIFV
jgi:hypothetical protein